MAVMVLIAGLVRLGITSESRRADELLRMSIGAHEGEFWLFEWCRSNGGRPIIVNLVSLLQEIFQCHSGWCCWPQRMTGGNYGAFNVLEFRTGLGMRIGRRKKLVDTLMII